MSSDVKIGINNLIKRDSKFALLVNQLGLLKIENKNLTFESLLKIIINQQLSNKVADVIFLRLQNLFKSSKEITPDLILCSNIDEMRETGISFAKISFMKNLAKVFQDNPNIIQNWVKLDDINAKMEIEKLNGFGPWSSNIILLFYLGRQDIFPYGDTTLKKAYLNIYKEHLSKELKELDWARPYRSILALYFWKWVDNGMVEL